MNRWTIWRYKRQLLLLAFVGVLLFAFAGQGVLIVDILAGVFFVALLAGAGYLFLRLAVNSSSRVMALGLGVAAITLFLSGSGPIEVLLLLALIYLVLRVATRPLSRVIARFGYSIRWKQEIIMGAIAFLFLLINLIHDQAMDYMHDELHEIQDTMASQPFQISAAINALEDTHHSFFYRMLPVLGVFGMLGATALGAAMAWSVIDPVGRMGQAMRRIASGDFSQPVQVDNRDELGELAAGVNHTAQELTRLQEATLAEERARALQERFTQVTMAQEEERRRISRELHDDLGPSLAAIGNRLRACQYVLRTDPQRAERELEDIASSLKGQVQQIRELIYDLRPLALDQLGITGALKQHVERFGQQNGMQASFSAMGNVTLDPLTEVTVFRVVQECLNNIQKHSKATRVKVGLQVIETGLEVRVEDNGRGFDPKEVDPSASASGLGLMSMQERADQLRGSLSVQSSPGNGCQVILNIPLREVEVGAHSNPPGR